jgi:hypothetical protein
MAAGELFDPDGKGELTLEPSLIGLRHFTRDALTGGLIGFAGLSCVLSSS